MSALKIAVKKPLHVCETCFGPLEIVYDYAVIVNSVRPRQKSRRYHELLPIDGESHVGMYSRFTPLVKADGLADALGAKELYIEDDSVNHPTFRIRMAWSR